jgi:hypothetical protein
MINTSAAAGEDNIVQTPNNIKELLDQNYSGEDNYSDFLRLSMILDNSGDSEQIKTLKKEAVIEML